MLPNGFLEVRVYTSRSQIPLEGATVAVILEGTDSEMLEGVRLTNREGTVGQISIDTPPLNNSTSPFGDKGFATCSIRIEINGYYTTIIKDAQIFPDVTTLQEIEMIPLKENSPESERLKTIIVPAQNL